MALLQELCWVRIILGDAGVRVRIRCVAPILLVELWMRLNAYRAGSLPHTQQRDTERTLAERIRYARSKGELNDLVEEIQAEFEAGHLSQAQAERLAALTTDTARQLARGLINVPVGAV